MVIRRWLIAVSASTVLSAALCPSAWAADEVVLRRNGRETDVTGQVLIEAQDGGLLLLARDGVLWAIQPDEKAKHTNDAAPFRPMTPEELSRNLLAELPHGFKKHETAHYLILYDTSQAYAQWCGALFERLYSAFTNFWSRKGFELHEPEFPLVAIVCADRSSYLKLSRPDLGDTAKSVIGYYALLSNHMTMYDLTGVEAQRREGRGRTTAQINQILARPDALDTVAVIVHEATHQIAFNCGLHARLSDCPVWFCEGIATYFETPDLRNSKGWSGIGAVNPSRLERFRNYLPKRPADSLETLIRDNKRIRSIKDSEDAYAEAWALTYFLLKQHQKEYVAYLGTLSKKKPLHDDSPQVRIDEFQKAFGDLKKVDAEFVRFMERVR